MHITITGGAGFLGQRLARKLLAQGSLPDQHGQLRSIRKIILVDVIKASGFDDSRIDTVIGDITDSALLERVITPQTAAVFHLAAIVSGQAEADFDLGMRINMDAARLLLERCRACGHAPRVIFTSSVAVFGGTLPAVVQEHTALNPQSSYGTQKAIAELLLNDYSRKGFVDGRVLRLPTISVRPGKPNQAASSFASGIIREPLNNQPAVCPVTPETRLWLLSPRSVIACLIHGYSLSAALLEKNRTINLPGLSVTVAEMINALERVAGNAVAARIIWAPDPVIERIISSWPGAWDTSRANQLGFIGDNSFDDVIRAYIEDDLSLQVLPKTP